VFTVALPVTHVADKVAEVAAGITAADVEAELGAVETEIEIDADKPVVLVIDDNRDIQRLIGELLSPQYNIITAPNGAEGIRRAVRYVPDLIICDVMMPVMDGLECCRRLKAEVTTSHIPVLMLTACSMDEQRVQGYDSGADGYLVQAIRRRCAAGTLRVAHHQPQAYPRVVGASRCSGRSGRTAQGRRARGPGRRHRQRVLCPLSRHIYPRDGQLGAERRRPRLAHGTRAHTVLPQDQGAHQFLARRAHTPAASQAGPPLGQDLGQGA